MLHGITKFVQYYLAGEDIWDDYHIPIPKGCCVIAEEFNSNDIVFKIGDGVSYYKDLPIWLRFSRIETAYYLNGLDFDLSDDVDKILYIDKDNKIKATTVNETDIAEVLSLIEESNLGGNITIPEILGPPTLTTGKKTNLRVKVYDLIERFSVPIKYVTWETSFGELFTGKSINYLPPNNATSVTMKVRVKDKYNNISRYGIREFLINDDSIGYVNDTESEYKNEVINIPIVHDINWTENNHYENHTYTMFIDAEDLNGLDLSYEVIPSDDDIIVQQDVDDKNKFHITYPIYGFDQEVYFLVIVTNSDGKESKISIKKRVYH